MKMSCLAQSGRKVETSWEYRLRGQGFHAKVCDFATKCKTAFSAILLFPFNNKELMFQLDLLASYHPLDLMPKQVILIPKVGTLFLTVVNFRNIF